MTHQPPEEPPRSGEETDPGPPVRELALLAERPGPDFVGRILRSVQRRVFVSEAVDLSWFGLGEIFRQYWIVVTGLVRGPRDSQGGSEQ